MAGKALGVRRVKRLFLADGTELAGVDEVPLPIDAEHETQLTILDVGWEAGQLLATDCWLAEAVRTADQVVLAEGVDEEPVERNRRLFTRKSYLFVAAIATLYALTHMIALNGVSIRDWTGINIPLLPTFPMETWNFRIVHVSGALALGFLLFAARLFPDTERPETRMLSLAGLGLILPALALTRRM